MSAVSSPATSGLRRHQRQTRSLVEIRRARIGRPATNRARSSAIAPAVAYRWPGSRAIAL